MLGISRKSGCAELVRVAGVVLCCEFCRSGGIDYRLLHWIVIVVLHGVFWARTAVAESPCDGAPNGFLKRFAICRCPEFFNDFTKPARDQRCPYNERIEIEPHDFTHSATTVGRHVVQIESGYS